ncbi:MAG: hypothetical protein KY476_21255, partial [Planctomycetes bacterium]|nr:hypothetical protein [Planctomycetota bacterium]
CGADRLYGYHFEPASFRCVPPVIRPRLRQCRPEAGEHVLVYNQYHMGDGGSADELVAWAWKRRQRVRAYGFPQVERGRRGLVEFRPADAAGMLDDLCSARAVIASAGLTTPVEAYLLGKPTAVVPIPGQWEQYVNAFHQRAAGIAEWFDRWDYDALLELAPPSANGRVRRWLETTPEEVLAHVLDELPAAGAMPEDVHRRVAA